MSNAAVDLSEALARAVAEVEPSVVRVDGGRRRSASGTVYSTDGVIVTPLHRLEREEGLSVFDGVESVPVTWVGAEPGLDLAVLKADRPLGRAAEFVAEGELSRGHLVLSVGRPGRSARVGLGVVAGLSGEWRTPRGSRVAHYVQVGLPLEPGFSGGLVSDVRGRAIGVGMGGLLRAVPLVLTRDTLARVVPSLLEHGRVQRAYLGVSAQPVRLPAALAERAGQPTALLVAGIEPEGPAERAGVGLGDVLLAVDGERLLGLEDLFGALEAERIERAVSLKLLRAGAEQSVPIVPKARP